MTCIGSIKIFLFYYYSSLEYVIKNHKLMHHDVLVLEVQGCHTQQDLAARSFVYCGYILLSNNDGAKNEILDIICGLDGWMGSTEYKERSGWAGVDLQVESRGVVGG